MASQIDPSLLLNELGEAEIQDLRQQLTHARDESTANEGAISAHVADVKGHMSTAQKSRPDITGVVASTEDGDLIGVDGGRSKIQRLSLAEYAKSDFSGKLIDILGDVSPDTEYSQSQTVPAILGTVNIYIDGVAGNDTTGNGNIDNPYHSLVRLQNSSFSGVGANVFIAADATYEVSQTFAQYIASPSFTAGNKNAMNGTANNPVVHRPYYPRGASKTKPIIKWYANIQASDWVQDGTFPNVWHLNFVQSGFRGTQNVNFLLGANEDLALAYRQQDVYEVDKLNANGQYAANNQRVSLYCTSNPTSFYGIVKLIGGGSLFGGYSIFSAFNNFNHCKFYNLHFVGCQPIVAISSGTSAAVGIEVAYCTFEKCISNVINNSSTASTVAEMGVTYHHNTIIKSPTRSVTLQTNNNSNNRLSYKVFSNKVYEGNLSSAEAGALIYVQARAGTNRDIYCNYGYKCYNGTGDFSTDGAFIYADIGTDSCAVYANIAEECGQPYQFNCLTGTGYLIANLAVDCGCFGNVTNAAPQTTAPSFVVAQNTYLWTGRVRFEDIPAGPDIGGAGARNWKTRTILGGYNQQRQISGDTAFNNPNLVFANNLFVNVSDENLTGRTSYTLTVSFANNLVVAGNVSLGFNVTSPIVDAVGLTTPIVIPRAMALIGNNSQAKQFMPQGRYGSAIPSQFLGGIGEPLTVTFKDITGNDFKAKPSVGCFERY